MIEIKNEEEMGKMLDGIFDSVKEIINNEKIPKPTRLLLVIEIIKYVDNNIAIITEKSNGKT